MLKREYRYLQKLHPLPQVHRAVQFMRMRPPAFPTVRLAQLAALLQQEGPLLARVLEADGPEELRHWLGVTANDYWNTHYRFDEESALAPKHLGTTMIENIFINTLVPLLFAWGHHHGQELLKERALQWLRALPPESNSVLKRFQKIGISADGAGDAQALLYLYKEYCAGRRCLDCAIGNALLKRDTINKAEGAS